jgi:outer membrane lipoprotein-sorting protein
MSDIPPSLETDDPVDRAASALRQTSVPGGPSDEAIARILSALRVPDETVAIPASSRRRLRFAWKIAIAGLMAASVVVYFTGLLPPRPPSAFAEIAAKLHDARTLTYEVTYTSPGKKEPEKARILYKEPGRVRTVATGQISITDLREGKTLILDSTAKAALMIDYKRSGDPKSVPREKASSMIDELRKLTDKKGESVGKKRIGDLETEGFRVQEEGFTLTLWANPKTRMPVLIEMPLQLGDQESLVTMSDFQLDTTLDDELFRLELPEGYQLRTMELEMEAGNLADDVVQLLRAYAGMFDGKFPKSLSITSMDWQTYFKRRWGEKTPKGLPETEAIQFAARVMRVEKFLRDKKDHGYKPDSVKFGDRSRIIFWYRPDKADTYRAVYGDLHVADVTPDQLPGA